MSLPNLSVLQFKPTHMKHFSTYTVKILSAITSFFIMNQVNTFSPSLLLLDVSIAMDTEYHSVLKTLSAVSLQLACPHTVGQDLFFILQPVSAGLLTYLCV